jgi:hypothetical protein
VFSPSVGEAACSRSGRLEPGILGARPPLTASVTTFLIVLFLFLLVVLHLAGRRYRALFRPDRVLEIARGLIRIEEEARTGRLADPSSELPAGTFRTTSGYVLRHEVDASRHVLAFSFRQRGFAVTAAAFLAGLACEVHRLEPEETIFSVAPDETYRLSWERARPVVPRVPDEEEIPALLRRCWNRTRAMRASIRPFENA